LPPLPADWPVTSPAAAGGQPSRCR